MPRERSPRYPAITLEDALFFANKLWESEKRTSVSILSVAKAWGYKGDNGIVRTRVATLRQYGLVEGVKDNIRLTSLAIEILANQPDSPDYLNALRKAALTPPLFSELYQSYKDASIHSIEALLITKKEFSKDGATQAARTFKSIVDLLSSSNEGYNSGSSNDERGDEKEMFDDNAGDDVDLTTLTAPGIGSLHLRVPFRGSEMILKIVAKSKLTRAHLARARQYLEMAEEDLNEESSADGSHLY